MSEMETCDQDELREIGSSEDRIAWLARYAASHRMVWQFTGQDRYEWPFWVRAHPFTASHMPYGPGGETFITCLNSNHLMLAPEQFWLSLADNGDIWAHHPDGAPTR